MKKLRLSLFILLACFCYKADAVLPDGSVAPLWTLTDLNGITHDLQTELNAGRHVIIDFSATWCPPCWNYHTSGVLDDIYHDLGPNGTNAARVYFMEPDASTVTACLYGQAGCNGTSMGNWVAGTDYPIFDLQGPDLIVGSNYNVTYFPTIYVINANTGLLYETGQASYNSQRGWIEESFLLDGTATTTNADCGTYGSVILSTVGGYGSKQFQWSNGATTQSLMNALPGTYTVKITDANGFSVDRGPYVVGMDNSGAGISVNLNNINDASCFGGNDGSIDITATGGLTSNYTYQWSNGATTQSISNLSAGTYSVVITDDLGCFNTDFYSVSEPTPFILTQSTNNSTCGQSNGSIVAVGVGGVQPYEYFLDGSYSPTGVYTNLSAGTYNLETRDANGCEQIESVDVMDESTAVAVANVSEVLTCSLTEITLSGMGSSTGTNFSYEWLDEMGVVIGTTEEVVVSVAGDYTLEVTDATNGCTDAETVTATANTVAPMITSTNAQLTCTQTSVEICADADATATVSWTVNGTVTTETCITVSVPGDYEATATATNGCTAIATSVVSISDDIPEGSIAPAELLTCTFTKQILAATVMGNLADHTLTWSTTNGNIVQVVSPTEAEVDAPGVYNLSIVNDATGCELLTEVLVEENINTPVSGFDFTYTDFVLTLNDGSQGTPSSWSWSVDGNNISTDQNTTYNLTGAETYDVCLTITNECGTNEHCEEVSVVTPLQATYEVVHVVCNGGSTGEILLIPDGGTPPYEVTTDGPMGYSDNSLNPTGLVAGFYDMSLSDDDGTVFDITIEVTETDAITAEATTTNTLCNGGDTGIISIDQTLGGNGDFDYAWSDGGSGANRSGLSAGTYSCVITDKEGCNTTVQYIVGEPAPINIDGLQTDIACYGETSGALQVTVTGGTSGYTYLWDNGSEAPVIANLGPGMYTCVVTDANGCQTESSYTLEEPDELLITDATVVDDTGNESGEVSIVVQGGTMPYEYLWSNGSTDATATGLGMGTYSVQVTDANGCIVGSGDYEVQFTSSATEILSLDQFNVYPNPASTELQIDLSFDQNQAFSMGIYGINGQLVQDLGNHNTDQLSKRVRLDNINTGLYLLYIRTQNGVAVRKVSILK